MNDQIKHPTDHQINSYLNGTPLSSDLLDHIEKCQLCQQHVAAYQAVDIFIYMDKPAFPADKVTRWSAEVMDQVQQLEDARERATDRLLWLVPLSTLLLAVIGLGFAGVFGGIGTVWSLISSSLAGPFLIACALVCIILYMIDRIEKKLGLDPLQLTLRISSRAV